MVVPQNLALSDLKDVGGVQRAKRGKNDEKPFNLVYTHDNGVLELKPVVSSPKPRPIRHIDLALRATIITHRLQRDRASHLVKDFPMWGGSYYKLWYRIYDDSGNLYSMYEQAKDRFKFNIELDLGVIEKGEWSSFQINKIPINFDSGKYDNIIEGDVFNVDWKTRSINVSIVLETKETLIFPGFRIRLHFEPINIANIHGYDFHLITLEPSFEPRRVTETEQTTILFIQDT